MPAVPKVLKKPEELKALMALVNICVAEGVASPWPKQNITEVRRSGWQWQAPSRFHDCVE